MPLDVSQEIHTIAREDREHEEVDESEVPNDNTFAFGEQSNMSFLEWQSGEGMAKKNSHQILFPRLKELVSVYDDHPPEKILEVAAVLDDLIQKGKAESAAMQQEKLAGQVVSVVAINMHARKQKQAKQTRHT